MATIKEVAAAAGVSISTVSRAFNNYSDINGKTKERILEAARSLDYSPNISARNLSSKKRLNLGLIISGFLNENANVDILFGHMKGAFRYASENNLDLALYITSSEEQKRLSYHSFCIEHSLAGAIISGLTTDDNYYQELSRGVPCPSVMMDIELPSGDAGIVTSDNRSAMKDMIAFLLSEGHEKIAIIAGKKSATVTKVRLDGVRDAYAEKGIPLNENDIYYADFSRQEAYEITKRLAGENRKYSAHACFSDEMAFGVIRALQEEGIKIPQECSVTGFDDVQLSGNITPALTTVRQDFEASGYEAAGLLHRILEGKDDGRRMILKCPIIIRQSTKACK